MRRAMLFAVVLVLGLGSAGYGISISGFVNHELRLDFGLGGFDDIWGDTEIGIEADLRGWTVGMFIDIETDGWEDLEFFLSGSFGAFEIFSWYEFYGVSDNLTPTEVRQDWDTVVQMPFGGVDFWGVFSMAGEESGGMSEYGSGAAFGFNAMAGPIEIWSEMRFNLRPFVRWVFWNGMDMVLSRIQACDLIDLEDPTCEMDFNRANIYVSLPFCCADIVAKLGIEDDGFHNFQIWLERIDTGLDWLAVDFVGIWYDVDGKDLDVTLDLSFGDASCITPYGSLDLGAADVVNSISLDGLGLVCPIGDVSLAVSALWDDTDYYIGEDARIHPVDGGATRGRLLLPACVEDMGGMDFALGLEAGGAGCCAPYQLGLYAFFWPSSTALFDLQHIRLIYRDEIGENVSWSMEVWAEVGWINAVEFTLTYTWGEPWLVNSTESCCSYPPPP